MDNKVMKFELNSRDLKVKELLNKDFLELEFKAISTANPNRNGSHFTKESLEKAIPTFYEKPILGSFSVNKDDFRGHEGELEYDPELDNLYYDYNDDTSEVPLGMIRHGDTVKIVHNNKDGLDWLVFTCAIWVKYNYKQVKSLLKSRNNTKKISVEVEVTDFEIDENGVEIIKEFVFDGCTILGDHLETGIADAELTILDKIENALFQKKQQCLAFAYQALDNVETPEQHQDSNIKENFKDSSDGPIENESPEEEVTMEDQKKSGKKESEERRNSLMKDELKNSAEFAEDVCPECGENPCICEAKKEDEACGKANEACGDKEAEACDNMECEACDNMEVEACGDKEEEAKCGCETCAEAPCETCAQEEEPEEEEPVKEEEACGETKFEHEEGEGHKCIECTIRDLIIDEEEAIQGYSHAEKHFEEEYPLIAKIFHELKEEEEKHIGELQVALQMVNDESQEHIEEGMAEANEIIVEEIQEQMNPEEEPEEEPVEQQIFADEEPRDNDNDDIEDDGTGSDDDPEDKDPDSNEPDDDDSDDDHDDEKDDPEPDDDDDDESDDDDDDDKDDDREEFAGAKGEKIDPNKEPAETRLPDSVVQGITDATKSISAPPVQLEIPSDGTTVGVTLGVGPDGKEASRPVEGVEEDGNVQQPDDKAKEFAKMEFAKVTDTNVNIAELLEKYNALQEQFTTLSNSVKAQEALALAEFGKNFINEDEFVPEETRNEYAAQVAEKCNNFEFTTEEEVTKFAKSLLAMYYYENRSVVSKDKGSEFNLNLQKQTVANTQASNMKLKDAINKLNHTN